MRLFYLFIICVLFFSTQTASASSVCAILSMLRIGSTGQEVQCLQAIIGVTLDGKFGPQTKAAVMNFQFMNGLISDGIVGPKTQAALFRSTFDASLPDGCFSREGYSARTGVKCDISAESQTNQVSTIISSPGNPILGTKPPKVSGVFPEKVRAQDTVKIYGENFSATGNTVRLRYGQIEDRFENLPSSDGKIISFVYQPPEVRTMNKEELLNLPYEIINKILDPVKKNDSSIDDIVAPYRNMRNEDDLKQFLASNGHSFDELYDKFYVTVENKYGRGSSKGPILTGLRKLSFGDNAFVESNKNFLFLIYSAFKDFVSPTAYAQLPQGGTNSGIITYCTCGSGYLTTMVDFSTNGGSGLYWWAPGFVPTVGNPIIAGPQLGFFTQNGGQCSMYAGTSCFTITANIANLPWGEGL